MSHRLPVEGCGKPSGAGRLHSGQALSENRGSCSGLNCRYQLEDDQWSVTPQMVDYSLMKLSERVLEELARMVVGDAKHFPYRSSSYITRFFSRCGLPFVHDGSTRPRWAQERLAELNLGAAQFADLPSDDLCRVISELFDQDDFERYNERRKNQGETSPDYFADVQLALASLNKLVQRAGLLAYLDESGRCYLRSTGTGMSSASFSKQTRPLSQDEIVQRQKIADFLDTASEDDFTEKVLVQLFQRLGFHRVSPSGHTEKTLEFGKDLWMKYQLPTSHWIYLCAQIKRDKIDASSAGGNNNVATVLAQARMAIDHPIFDPEANRKVLLDHVFLISAGEITRAARTWLVEQLDAGQRRHIIFMDRDEFLDQSARILLDLRLDSPTAITDEDMPF
jgi:hypothetical protein